MDPAAPAPPDDDLPAADLGSVATVGDETGTADAPDPMARPTGAARPLIGAAPLLVSLSLLMLGMSLQGSVLGLRGPVLGFATITVGIILSGYYLGFLVGSTTATRVIGIVGHVRAFAGLASTASAAVLLHAVWNDPIAWWVLRIIAGVCQAGLFVIAESWLNSTATNESRGRLLATYMVVVTGSIGVAQLLLLVVNPQGFGAIVLASVLVSASVVPISLMPASPPVGEDPTPLGMRSVIRAAPLAAVGAAVSGFAGAAAIGAGAVYGASLGLSVNQIALLLAAVLAGAIVLQFPLGLLSDRVDRRKVIAGAVLVAAAASLVASTLGADQYLLLVGIATIAGGTSYPLYAISLAHLNDWLEPGAIVAAGARMVLLSGAGAVAGPLGAALAIDRLGPEGFFLVLAAAYLPTGAFALYRVATRPAATDEQRVPFAPLPPGTTPTLAGLSPDAAEELHPLREHHEVVGSTLLRWRERGSGPPIVLVHDAGSSSRSWDAVALALADRGHGTVAHDLRGHGMSGSARSYRLADHLADLAALLDHLELYRFVLVGHGAGASIAARYAMDRPDRVHALVLVSAERDLARNPGQAVLRVADRSAQTAARTVLGARAAGTLRAQAEMGGRRDPEVRRRLAADLASTRRGALTATRRDARRVAQRIGPGDLLPPTLWVRGERLRVRPTDLTSLVVIPGAGHFVQLEEPETVAATIADFVGQATETRLAPHD